jgi:hypothetical protein
VMQDAPPRRHAASRLVDGWASASPVRKVTLIALAPALLACVWMLRQPTRTAARETTTPTAASVSVDKDPAPPPAATGSVAIRPSGARASDVEPQPHTDVLRVDAVAEKARSGDTLPTTRTHGSRTTPARKTPERAALDAAAEGSFGSAAEQYAALSAQHPDNVAFRESARILGAKARPGGT